jgi:hypothetical protein
MATYKYPQYLVKLDHSAFDAVHLPGQVPPFSGIYRCTGCGREVVAEQGRQLPPQNHHQHAMQLGPVQWQLLAFADHNPKK